MITPLDESEALTLCYSACDIENTRGGKVLAIGTYNGDTYTTHKDWGEWLAFIRLNAATDHRYRTIYAHNGGGWDWLSLLDYIIREIVDLPFSTVQNGNTFIMVTIPFGNGVTIRLVDSLRLLQSSLDKAGRTYVGRGKVDTGGVLPETLYRRNRKLFTEYLRNDTILLFDTISAFAHTLYNRVARVDRLGITLPSTAMRVFRTGFLSDEIRTPTDSVVKQYLRNAYTGGRVEVFHPGYHKRINVYDVNSLYPSVMVDTPVPITDAVQWTTRLHPSRCGVYEIEYNQTNRRVPPVMVRGGAGLYCGRGFFFTNEIRRLLSAGASVRVVSGFVFTDSAVVFDTFIRTLYKLRLSDRNGPIGAMSKLMMNSLYGKFGQKPERTTTRRMTYEEMLKYRNAGYGVELLNAENGIYRVTLEREAAYEHVGIAGTITSEARARLWESMNLRTVYCDTDSIHTPDTLPVSDLLGDLKLEFSGEGVYCGKKLYALRNGDTEKVRVKGVRIGGALGCRLDFAALKSVAAGASVVCRFKSPTTSTAVIKGIKSCRMLQRKRTIRQTANRI